MLSCLCNYAITHPSSKANRALCQPHPVHSMHPSFLFNSLSLSGHLPSICIRTLHPFGKAFTGKQKQVTDLLPCGLLWCLSPLAAPTPPTKHHVGLKKLHEQRSRA